MKLTASLAAHIDAITQVGHRITANVAAMTEPNRLAIVGNTAAHQYTLPKL